VRPPGAPTTGRGAAPRICWSAFTVTNSLDGISYALITGATFGWLCPH
jgi:hypothetical protein